MPRPLSLPLLAALTLVSPCLGQATRQRVEVTPDGIFYRSETASAAAPAANPNPSPVALRWRYPNPSGLPWITQSVGTGEHGTLAWLGQNLNGQRLSLLASSEQQPPQPIWELLLAGAQRVQVAAADRNHGCALAVVQTSSGPYQVHYLRSGSAAAAWSATQTVYSQGSGLETAISADGRWVTAGYNDASNVATVDVHDAFSANPSTPFRTLTATSHQMRNHDISGDGRYVLLGTHTMDHVLDVVTRTDVFQAGTVSHDAHSINYNGDTFARGGFDVGAWKRSGSTYNRILDFKDSTLSFGIYTACDVSADGSTLVVAATDANNNYLPFRVYCWQLTPTSATLLWTYSAGGAGSYQDTPQAVAVSDDGRWIAVGSWGDGAGSHPEVMLFDKLKRNVPVASIDTPGSVFDVDLSGDGQFLIAGSKAVHANVFGNGGEGYSLDRGGQGHRLKGTPSVGRTLTVETGGYQGDLVNLILGSSLWTPITIPGIQGQLAIDVTQPYSLVTVGTVPASQLHSFPLPLPSSTSLVGVRLYTQTLRAGTQGLEFDNHLRLLITP